MVFSSHLFIFYFLPLSLLIYHLLPMRGKHIYLTFVSYIFYGWANPWFVFLMMFQTVVDWIAGRTIAQRWGLPAGTPGTCLDPNGPRTRSQKLALAAGICSNLALLGFFKYFNFGLENWNATVNALGLEGARWDTMLRITLPLGISFYTFQSMSYAIDVYRGDAKAIDSILDYMCYVAMFPQLVAGPIVRFQDVADQFFERSHTAEKFGRGVCFVALGLGKKILLANPCGKIADTMFDAGSVGCLDAWHGVVSYAFQIYFDFSAYSDMAIGLGLMTGWVFAKNFDSPYMSQSITEFWRRWHLSLSTWLRDNLYFPLGGNRRGEVRTYINLALVMLLGGLWHGAAWNFVIWGAIHGTWLGVERAFGKHAFYQRLPRALRIATTFLIVLIAWVFFRAKDLPSSWNYLSSMFGFGGHQAGMHLVSGLAYQPYFTLSLAVAAFVTWTCPQTWDFTRRIGWGKAIYCLIVLLVSLAVMETQAYNPFIYFIF